MTTTAIARAVPKTQAPRPALFAIAWPIFAEFLLGMTVGGVGLWLASKTSDSAAGAFAMANHLMAALFILFRVVGIGVSVVVTQNLGAGRRAQADAVARAGLGASTWMGLGIALASLLLAGPLLRLMSTPPEVLPLAIPFLQTLAIALALDAYNATMASVMRAHLHGRDALFVMGVMHAVHLLLAGPLMRGIGPLPGFGLVGFAMALAASRATGLALHLWLWRLRLDLVPQRSDWWALPAQQLKGVLHIGLPGAAENIAYRLAFMVSVAVAAKMGASALATQSYAMQVMYYALLFGLATGFASEIMVGHLIGAGALHEAHRLVRRNLMRGLAVSTSAALLAATCAPWLLRLFTHDPAIIEAATKLLWITVLLEPGRTFNLV
ncbi:MAG TPA: MATE family efflux transporter, partial [Methylibium sp.]